VGWATVSGDGVSSTTGGGNAAAQRPKSASELMALASDATPRVIEIAGSFDVPELDIASNKTLIGIGKDATIRGGLRIHGDKNAPVRNVIVRNLNVNGATTAGEDAVQIYFAHHVWIDHCNIWDGPDGNLDLTHAVNWVTISWNKIRYTSNYKRPDGESADHRFASLVGHSDNNAGEDEGRLKISFHHNYWAEGVIERMPRVRFGQVHVFNNYFASPGNNYCVRAGRGAHLLIEANHFDHVGSPHQFNNSEDEATAHITARDNVYDGVSGDQKTGGGGAPFTSVPYPLKLDSAADIPALVKSCAAPR
jgi:pectate lyase